MIKGYSIRISESTPVRYSDGPRPAWVAKVRRKGWSRGYWAMVNSAYGPIVYGSPESARDGARTWIQQNEEAKCL